MREEEKEELDDMPIWQDHEQRITSAEIKINDIQNDFRAVRSEFQEVKDKIDQGNTEQIKKLDSFYERLADDFFKSKNDSKKYKWKFATKVVGALLGSGGIIYIIIDLIMEGI